MTRFGFHASHEQIPPGQLLRDVHSAEQTGFTAAMCSDHFAPWSAAQGESGFAWSWLGAALATTQVPFGVVTAPGQRYHPAVHAQAIATLAAMFPGRFWAALGSGQAMNEHVTGERWLPKKDREARLLECVEVIRALLTGEEVTHRGLVTVDRARIWSLPEIQPMLLGAAVTPATAAWVGGWADGLISVNQPIEVLRDVVDSFRAGGGEGKTARLQVHISWAPTDDEAHAIAHEQWAPALLGSPVAWELALPEEFEQIAAYVRPDDVHPGVLASADPSQHVAWLGEFADLGFDEIYVHHVGQHQQGFLDVYGSTVLPALEGR